MRRRILLEKRVGETPLEALTRWRDGHPAYRTVAASYAGRLDPMASGKLLILFGDECKRQKEYTELDKEYRIEVLLDIGSDTGDVLGIVEAAESDTHPDVREIQRVLTQELGEHPRPYPIFSSKPVAGKPLFLHALEGSLDTIEIPTHMERIRSIRYRGAYTLSTPELFERITSLLSLAPRSDEPSKELGADFRIHDVRNSWQPILLGARDYTVLKLTVRCGSGTYMRALAARIGEALDTRALALSIHRNKICGIRTLPFGLNSL